MPDDPNRLPPRVLSSERPFTGRLVKVRVDTVETAARPGRPRSRRASGRRPADRRRRARAALHGAPVPAPRRTRPPGAARRHHRRRRERRRPAPSVSCARRSATGRAPSMPWAASSSAPATPTSTSTSSWRPIWKKRPWTPATKKTCASCASPSSKPCASSTTARSRTRNR